MSKKLKEPLIAKEKVRLNINVSDDGSGDEKVGSIKNVL